MSTRRSSTFVVSRHEPRYLTHLHLFSRGAYCLPMFADRARPLLSDWRRADKVLRRSIRADAR